MSTFPLRPGHKPIKLYYEALARFKEHGHTTEGNTRSAFADLLKRAAGPYDWHLVEEYQFKGTAKQSLRADGALVDSLTLVHGLWEAKDSADDLAKEIKAKVAKGYPLTNILFQSPTRAVLYQDSRIALDCDLTQPENLVEVLQLFFDHRQPHEVDWEEAVFKFAEKIPDLAHGVTTILTDEHKKNADFRQKFQAFADLCRQSINPDLTDPAIQKMLVQHLLTERIFRKVFNNQEFLSRNVIAAEIEKVIHSITAKHFSRDTFLKPLDRFYTAIEKAAEQQEGYTEKQHFLNAVYEKFFQSFDKKQADTHGIVYTPQPIVDFMVRSVEEILKSEFGKSLSDEGVHILDPFTGTGNFITRIMQQIKTSRLPQKYANELHCNEVMLLPYYIASMNIEHAYTEKVGEYGAFEGICLVDTFELAEAQQATLFTTENTERVRRQKVSKITVVIANPPYNAKQDDERDANKNRPYKNLDRRVRDTYTAGSLARLRSKLGDPYVKAFRWASDRVGKLGVVAYISNNSFLEQVAFDGMRFHLAKDFSRLLIIDLGGNVRKNPKLSGTTHNVFGIQVGVCISFLIKDPATHERGKIFYARMPEEWRRGQKEVELMRWGTTSQVPWTEIHPDSLNRWLGKDGERGWNEFISLFDKSSQSTIDRQLVKLLGPGLKTNRDRYVFNFSSHELLQVMSKSIKKYALALGEYKLSTPRQPIDEVVRNEDVEIKWSRQTRELLSQEKQIKFRADAVRMSSYRPFTKMHLYFDQAWNDERGKTPYFFPSVDTSNVLIMLSGIGMDRPFQVLATSSITEHQHASNGQCFARYFFENGERRENITDWVLTEFRAHYGDPKITKGDIFHSTYALLHHPEYRTRYAANLKRELPRIPFPPDLHAFAAAGKRLMELHIDYEKQPEYPLEEIEHPGKPWTLRVEKMSLSKDKTDLRYNEALTLRGIPPAAFDYRLGNRSALEWVIDQYRVSTDPRSGIVNDPNREDDPSYILRLIKQVISVSLETQQIIATLPALIPGS